MDEKNYLMVKLLVVKIVLLVSSFNTGEILQKQAQNLNVLFILVQNIIRFQMTFASTIRKWKQDLDLLFKRSWAITRMWRRLGSKCVLVCNL
jgi:hypothetical protein